MRTQAAVPMPAPMPPPDATALYVAIAAWEARATALAAAKSAEGVERARLADLLAVHTAAHGGKLPDIGTLYVPLHNGWRLKGEFKLNISVNPAAVPDMLLRMSEHSEAGQHASNTVFRYKPELSATVYKQLMPALQAIVDTALTTSPASPVFTLVPPKDAATTPAAAH